MNKNEPDQNQQAGGEPETGQPDGAEDQAAADAQRVERDVEEAMQAIQQERDDFEQRLMRTAADFQNYRRRAEQNLITAREQQLMDVGRSLVTVLDHFDRAVAVDPQKTSVADLLNGMSLVRQELLRALEGHGVRRLDVQPGEAFDPNRHEALMRQASEDVETNHVIQQLQPGYELNEKTLRPAQVVVAE